MANDTWFHSEENRALMAICTRKLIRNIGIGALIWGGLNTLIGIGAIQETWINAGLLLLGILMLATGVESLRRPRHGLLLTQTVIAVLLLFWNLGISILNLMAGEPFDIQSLVFPMLVVIAFSNYYRKLAYLRDLIASVPAAKIATTQKLCKALVKKKLKNEPLVVETTNRRARAQLMDGQAFFIQRDMMRAFVVDQENLSRALTEPAAAKWTAVFHHPLGDLKYRFDKTNTAKLKAWLANNPVGTTPAPATSLTS